MIPICLITGFLGSRKTTLLEQWIRQYKDRALVYIVNEFSTLDIDGIRIQIPENQLVSLTGGSLFCRCLLGDFIRILRTIHERQEASGGCIEGVVIESSGIADPAVTQRILSETKFDQQYHLRRIISIVDPITFTKLIHTLPAILSQIRASDTVVINKSDACGPDAIQRVIAEIKQIHPTVSYHVTQYCSVDLDPFVPYSHEESHGEYAVCADPRYSVFTVQRTQSVDWIRLKQAIQPVEEHLYRVKGFVRVQSTWLYVDFASGHWNEAPVQTWRHAYDPTELVFIAPQTQREWLETLQAEIMSGKFDSNE